MNASVPVAEQSGMEAPAHLSAMTSLWLVVRVEQGAPATDQHIAEHICACTALWSLTVGLHMVNARGRLLPLSAHSADCALFRLETLPQLQLLQLHYTLRNSPCPAASKADNAGADSDNSWPPELVQAHAVPLMLHTGFIQRSCALWRTGKGRGCATRLEWA